MKPIRRRLFLTSTLTLGLLWGLGHPAAAQVRSEPLELTARDRIVLLGDSITHGGHYVASFQNALWCLMPEKNLSFFNAGVSGDVAANALERLDAEVIAQRPNVVTILLGMNDAGYQAFNEELLANYRRDMTAIVKRLRAETEAKLVLLSPTYFDQQQVPDGGADHLDYNGTLVRYGEVCLQLAKEYRCHFVDLNSPLRQATARLRRQDEKATLVPDAVHPAEAGGMVMAHAMLTSLLDTPLRRPLKLQASGKSASSGQGTFKLRAISPAWDTETCSVIAADLDWADRWNPYYLQTSFLGRGPWKVWVGDAEPVVVEEPHESKFILPASLVERATQVQALVDRRRRMVWTDIRDEVWKIKGDGTPASRKERYAKIHPQNLKLAWVKIVALNHEISTLLAQPLVVPYRVERLDD
ncbi:MAG: SGNH/GDSL hydrolase family protein [Planctomycetota bacterium]|jgi:lysophospholipase L1-like esterase|nr:SGNH/GDSL hydrolase family protein [Planctomycetota bacterium]